MTLTELSAEITLHTKTRGAIVHSGTTLNSLIGRALIDFVGHTHCNYSTELTYTLSSSSVNMNLETAGVTLGGSTVILLQANKIFRTNTPLRLLDKVDAAFVECNYPSFKTDTTGEVHSWFKESARAIAFIPVPSASTSLRIEGWYYPSAIVAGTGGSAVIDLPQDCLDAFVKFCIWRVLEPIADGSTVEFRAQLKTELFGDNSQRGVLAVLDGRYGLQVPAHMGYVNDGTVVGMRG